MPHEIKGNKHFGWETEAVLKWEENLKRQHLWEAYCPYMDN